MLYYFDSKKTASSIKMGKMLSTIVSQTILPEQEIIILCIGSDRSTGDSLGPLIGHQFKNYVTPGLYLIGDLHEPVHAANLNYCMKSINKTFDNPYIIAIDASLGKEEHIGFMTLATGPLKPGLGDNLLISDDACRRYILAVFSLPWNHSYTFQKFAKRRFVSSPAR